MTVDAGSRRRRVVGALLRPFRSRLVCVLLGTLLVAVPMGVVRLLDSPTDLEPGEIALLSGADESTGGQRQQLVDQWNLRHPNNRAKIVALSNNADEQHSAMVSKAQSGDADIDVFNLDVTWIAEFALAGYIRPLDASVSSAGFLKSPLDTARFRNQLWGLPFNTDAGLLYYRTDLIGPTWIPTALPPSAEEMAALALHDPKLQAGFAGQLASYEGLTVNALEAIWGAGGEVLDGQGHVVIDSDKAQAALHRLATALVATSPPLQAALPDSTTFAEENTTAAFRAGKVAMMRNWPVAYGQLSGGAGNQAGEPGVPFAVAQLPGASVLGGQDLAVASASRRPRAAQKLIEFLTSEDSERQLFADGGLAATRSKVYEDPRVRATRPYADILLQAIGSARPRPMTAHYALFSSVFQQIVKDALAQNGRLPSNATSRLAMAIKGELPRGS